MDPRRSHRTNGSRKDSTSMNKRIKSLLVALGLVLAAAVAVAEEHHYEKGDVVALLANKIGPYANPS